MITDVGIDLDGVLYDFATEFRRYCSKRLNNQNLPYPAHWEFYEDWGLDKDTFYEWLTDATKQGDLFRYGSPLPFTTEGWNMLKGQGLRIHILTHRHIEAVAPTAEWLQMLNLIPDSIHFGFDKYMLESLAKDQAAAIDDYTHYYDEYEKAGVKAFLLDQPWNRNHSGRRVKNLLEFACAVQAYNDVEKWEEKKTKVSTKSYTASAVWTYPDTTNYVRNPEKYEPHKQPTIWRYGTHA